MHTPGPWTSNPTTSLEFITRRIYGPNGEKIADVGTPETSNLDVHTEVDNARLLAAAPDLLAACEKLLALWDAWAIVGNAPSAQTWKRIAEHCEKARTAVGKAKEPRE